VTNLVLGGSGPGSSNYISITSLPKLLVQPQFPLIQYQTLTGGFNLTVTNLPAGFAGFLSNNAANSSIDLVLTTLPYALSPQWVHFSPSGTLVYYADNLGNHIPDFSYAGYKGGGVAIPTNVPVRQTLSPIAGDNTAQIQNAINYVSGLSPDANGFRGVVLLNPGTYQITGANVLTISANGVILRGSGNDTNTGTIFLVTGTVRNVLSVVGSGSWSKTGSTYTITDSYVPLGATNFHVSGSPGFAVGSTIVIQRPWTQPWINAIGMSSYWSPATGLQFERQVVAVSGNQVTIDVPLCNPIESQWATGQVYQAVDAGRIQQVGIENLCAISQGMFGSTNLLNPGFLNLDNMKNCWVRNVMLSGWGGGIGFGNGAKWCTLQDCQFHENPASDLDQAPAAWTISGAQCLAQRCTSDGPYYHVMVTQNSTPGPNVFLNLAASGTHYNGGPHQKWAAGVLHDGITMAADPDPNSTPYLAINNRGGDGSGQGWGAGFSIMYNCQVPQFQLEQPVLTNTYNWAIGGIGSQASYSDSGIYDAFGSIVNPLSLYLEQLKERLGPAAVQNIGYAVFNLSATPALQSVVPGNGVSFTVNVAGTNGFSDTVALGISGLPVGASATFSPASINGSGSATLTIVASNSIVVGNYPLTINGIDGNLTNTATVNLFVGTFSVSATPPSQTVGLGGANAGYTVNVTTNSGFAGNVVLGISGLPPSSAASFSPQTVTGAGSAILSVTTSNATPSGNYTLTITGTNGALTSATTVALTVSRPAANLVWASTSGGAWDITNSYNWFNAALAGVDQFYNGDSVLFDDTPGVVTNITISSGITALPAAVTNNSSANNFTISGPGIISGSTSLVKLGGSTLTIASANGFTGPVMIQGGTILVDSLNALGATSSPLYVSNGGTVDVGGSAFAANANPILGAKQVYVSGAGAGGNGAIVNNGINSQQNAVQDVILTGNATFGGVSRWDLRVAGSYLYTSPTNSNYKITKVGTNEVSLVGLTGIDPNLGDIDIQQGEFAIQTSTIQVGNPANTITIHSNAMLEVWALTAGPLNKQIMMLDGSTFFSESGSSSVAGPVTLSTNAAGGPGNCYFNIAGTALTLTNVVSGPGNLVKMGTSQLNLMTTNTYTGSTFVNAGTLALTNNGSISASTNIVIAAGAILNAGLRNDGILALSNNQTLGGVGTVTGNLIASSGSTVSPGTNSIGLLSVSGAVQLHGTTCIEVNKATATTNDQLFASGTMVYDGTLVVTNLGAAFAPGDSFKIFNGGGLPAYSGVFTNIVPVIPAVNLAWNTNTLANDGTLRIVSAPTPPPSFRGIAVAGNNFIFSGTNGVRFWTYYVLTSTNLSLSLSQWPVIATNTFDAAGNFNFTNTANAGSQQGYYLLKLQ
jgi:autotransporter-associated beta strand protein